MYMYCQCDHAIIPQILIFIIHTCWIPTMLFLLVSIFLCTFIIACARKAWPETRIYKFKKCSTFSGLFMICQTTLVTTWITDKIFMKKPETWPALEDMLSFMITGAWGYVAKNGHMIWIVKTRLYVFAGAVCQSQFGAFTRAHANPPSQSCPTNVTVSHARNYYLPALMSLPSQTFMKFELCFKSLVSTVCYWLILLGFTYGGCYCSEGWKN